MIQFTVQGGDSVLYGSQVRNNIFRRPRLQYNCLQTFQGRSCQQIFLYVLDKKAWSLTSDHFRHTASQSLQIFSSQKN